MELISREDLLERMKRKNVQAGEVNTPKRGRYMQYLSDLETIKEMPTVTLERKPGKWIKAIDPDVNAWTGGHTCSECGRACVQMSMNYCANCGAPMEVDNAKQ